MTEKSEKELLVLFRSVELMIGRLAREANASWPRIKTEEFFSIGKVAALARAEHYDPARGSFEAFVYHHVAGAMDDYARLEYRETNRQMRAVHDEWRRGPPKPAKGAASPRDRWAEIDMTPEQATENAAQEARLHARRMAEVALMVPNTPVDPETIYIEHDEARAAVDIVNEVLASFSDQQRNAFRLHRIEGLEQAVVADRLEISVATVRRYVEAVVEALDAAFEKAGIEPPKKRRSK